MWERKYYWLKYTGILIVLLVAQIIVVAVVFFSPTKYANGIVSAVEALLNSYGSGSEEENMSTPIWDVLMETDPKCCGMDGFKGFDMVKNTIRFLLVLVSEFAIFF
ncbi:hypothetical protein TSMEX_001900 [Taenia solium]|eukprot:TsM_000325700 transcript=TsM_000325700 gene=TsM_000325700